MKDNLKTIAFQPFLLPKSNEPSLRASEVEASLESKVIKPVITREFAAAKAPSAQNFITRTSGPQSSTSRVDMIAT